MEATNEFYLSEIVGFRGSWSSGMGFLVMKNIDGDTSPFCVPCENGSTARALISAFDCSGGGHTIDNSKLAGNRIAWCFDDMGLMLGGFIPCDSYEALDEYLKSDIDIEDDEEEDL